ncbi:MAG: mechanosensitive ion channel family protein, partial [bacterium]
ENADLQKDIEEAADISGILRKTEAAFDVYALCTKADSAVEETLIYSNDIFTALNESFDQIERSDVTTQTDDTGTYEFGTLSLPSGTFRYVQCGVPVTGGMLVLMTMEPNLYIQALSHSTYMFAALVLFLAALLVTGFSLYYYVSNNALSPFLEERYKPWRVRRFATLCGILGALCIFASGLLIYALNDLYDDTMKGKERLRILDESLQLNTDLINTNTVRFKDIYLEYSTTIAELLDNYPELREKSVLETLADTIDASSVTLYDAEGKETVSSSDFIGLVLGKNEKSTTYDFRRLLRGVPHVIHDAETDEITGLTEYRFGVRINDSSDPSKYGALIISIDPSRWDDDLQGMVPTLLENLSGHNALLCIADPESKKIVVSSNESHVGSNITVLGLAESDLNGSVIRNIDTESGSYFITSYELDSWSDPNLAQESKHMIAFYASAATASSSGMLISALTGCVLFILIYAILARLILADYTEEFYARYKGKGQPAEKERRGRDGIRQYLLSIRPERLGFITMEIIVGLYLTQRIPIANFKTQLARNSVYYYIASGNWEKGLNLFSLSATMILLGEILLAVILIRLLLTIISNFVGSKGKTICRLIRSLSMYVALFAFLIIACTYFGISMTVIIAAIGTLGISVSLGAQHFVSDIITGLTIVFEGTFHVGDIIDIDGAGAKQYHGEVREIGLRFTRLQTSDSNIVTISNRDINTINNMTLTNSRYVCKFEVSSAIPIKELEQMLARELPKIREKDRRILAGPYFDGIVSFGNGTMKLSVTTECSEKDIPEVKQIVNRTLQQALIDNGFQI